MKVGEYVRTKDYQNIRSRIGKIIKQDEKYYYLDIDEDTQMVWEEDTVLKSSLNIIDLIEVGDYVNGSYIYSIFEENKNTGQPRVLLTEEDGVLGSGEIKSIVTKEQFSQMEYRTGE
jgi:hypothetical protein